MQFILFWHSKIQSSTLWSCQCKCLNFYTKWNISMMCLRRSSLFDIKCSNINWIQGHCRQWPAYPFLLRKKSLSISGCGIQTFRNQRSAIVNTDVFRHSVGFAFHITCLYSGEPYVFQIKKHSVHITIRAWVYHYSHYKLSGCKKRLQSWNYIPIQPYA